MGQPSSRRKRIKRWKTIIPLIYQTDILFAIESHLQDKEDLDLHSAPPRVMQGNSFHFKVVNNIFIHAWQGLIQAVFDIGMLTLRTLTWACPI